MRALSYGFVKAKMGKSEMGRSNSCREDGGGDSLILSCCCFWVNCTRDH